MIEEYYDRVVVYMWVIVLLFIVIFMIILFVVNFVNLSVIMFWYVDMSVWEDVYMFDEDEFKVR